MNTSSLPNEAPGYALKPALGRWLATGTMASLASLTTLALYGRRRHGSSTSLINSPSHWVHGDRALRANSFSLRYTVWGALIHHLSSMFWAMFYEGLLGARHRRQQAGAQQPSPPPSAAELMAAASALSTIAWLVDTKVVPPRLTPGFERRSSPTGLVLIYGSFAVGLALGALITNSASKTQGKQAPAPENLHKLPKTGSP